MNNKTNARNDYGFTLLELMIVVSIVIIVIAASGTFLHYSQPTYLLNGASDDMWGNFNDARMEAIRRNVPVAISWSPGGEKRFVIYVDVNRDAQLVDGTDILLYDRSFIVDGLEIVQPYGEMQFAFDSRGYFGKYTNSGSIIQQEQLFVIKLKEKTRAVKVSPLGMMRYYPTGM